MSVVENCKLHMVYLQNSDKLAA